MSYFFYTMYLLCFEKKLQIIKTKSKPKSYKSYYHHRYERVQEIICLHLRQWHHKNFFKKEVIHFVSFISNTIKTKDVLTNNKGKMKTNMCGFLVL